MPIRNVSISPLGKTPPFRKLAIGTWRGPGDPQIYGILEIDLSRAYAWRDRLPPEAPKVTVTHMLARAIALALRRHPDLNGFFRFGKIYLRDRVDVFFQVAVKHESGRSDVAGVTLTQVDEKGVVAIAEEMAARLDRVRVSKNTSLQRTSRLMSRLPGFLVGLILRLSSFISYGLNLRFPGIPRDLFGGCMITNVGSIGLDVAFAPLVPYSRVPLLLLIGLAKDRPVVIDGKVEVRPIVTVNATIDHRFCDGALLAKMVRVVNEVFEDPERYFSGDQQPEVALPPALTGAA